MDDERFDVDERKRTTEKYITLKDRKNFFS